MTQQYEHKLAECDVSDENRTTLEKYRGKRLLWRSWIDDDEHHAIWQVLNDMAWRDVAMRSLTDLALSSTESALNNSLLMEALLEGHVAMQVLAIRRLIEDGRSVLSLRRLVKDVTANSQLITRENFVCFDGLPYDFAKVRDADIMERTNAGTPGGFWGHIKGPKAWSASEALHRQFDKMAGVDPADRQRGDMLPAAVFKTIERSLDASGAKELAEWSHVYLAHAGNPEERKKNEHLKVTSGRITETIRALCRVTEATSLWVLGVSSRHTSVVPTAQFDPFHQLDQPVMTPDLREAARELWHELSDERDAFLADITPELLRNPDTVL